MKKRIFSLLLALCLVAGMLPTTALAEGSTPDPTPISVTVNNCTNGTATVDAPDQWYEGANRFSVISKLPCVVIVEHNNGTDELLKCGEINATTGHYRFFVNAADGDTISIAVKGDMNLDGVVTNIIYERIYDSDGMAWHRYTFYSLNSDGTRTSERLSDNSLYNSGDFDVAKLSAHLSDPQSNTLSTLQQYAANINYDENVNQTDVDVLKSYISDSDTSVSWDIQYNCYTITFDTGDGGSTVSAQKVLEDEPATEPTAPTKAGYSFEGWYNGDNLYDFSTPVTKNITLTAKWTVDRVKLTKDILESNYKDYSLERYDYVLPSGNYYLGEDISVDIRVFIGDRNNAAAVTLDLNGFELKRDNSGPLISIYCSTSGSTSTLTLMDSSSAKTGKVISSSGNAVNLSSNSRLNANGGIVEGNVELSSSSAVIDNTDPSNTTVFTGEVKNNGTIKGGIFTGTVSGSGTIADSAKVTVTFNNDGSTVQEEKVLRGQKATEPTAPTKTGYSFEGWYNGDDLYDFDTLVTENITLTAKWSVVWTELTQTSIENFKKYASGNYYYGLPSGNYYLGENISLDDYYIDIGSRGPNANVTLDLNGFELRNDNDHSTLLFLAYNNTLTLTDSSSDKTGRAVNSLWLVIDSRANSTFNANGGTVEGNIRILDNTTVIDNTDPSNTTVFTGEIRNHGTIKGGIFTGTVSGSGTIADSAKVTVTFNNDGSTVQEEKVLRGQKASAPTAPTKAGYSFEGWYNGNTEFDVANTPVIENITLTAKWAKVVTATISAIPDATYTGSDIEPAITVYDGETVIPASEYTVSYSDNKNVGTATVTLADKPGGNYIVSGSTIFRILPKSIEDTDITLNGALTYNGTEQTQNVTVSLDGFDTVTFDVSGNKQTDVNTSGDYTLTVTGNGNFTGTKTLDWNIAPATPTGNSAKKTTARVRKNRTLADASVTNGEILAIDGTTPLTGTFAWVDSTKVMRADGTEQMTFTPDNTNYAPITIDVAVDVYSPSSSGGDSSTSSTKPTETPTETPVVGTIDNAANTSVKTETTTEETNKAAADAAKNDATVNLVTATGTTVSGDNFAEPVILSIPVDTNDVRNVNNLTLAKFNAETGKLEIVGGSYDAETKTVTGYIDKAGDYFVVEKDGLTTITLQIGNTDVTLNNSDRTLDAAPIISQDRTMVPLRFVSEAFGANVSWIDATKNVVVELDGKVLTMQIGKELEGFGAAPIINNNRTMVPIRYISEQLGAKVLWVPSTQTIEITR